MKFLRLLVGQDSKNEECYEQVIIILSLSSPVSVECTIPLLLWCDSELNSLLISCQAELSKASIAGVPVRWFAFKRLYEGYFFFILKCSLQFYLIEQGDLTLEHSNARGHGLLKPTKS